MGHAAQRLDIFFRLFNDDVSDIVVGQHADQPVLGIDYRRGDEVVTLKRARDFFLILVGMNTPVVLVDQ